MDNDDGMSKWEAKYRLERSKRKTECSDCGQKVVFDSDRIPSQETLKQTTIAFRCRVCARVLCRECSLDHFGFDGSNASE